MSEQDGQVSILAGNSRVYLDENGKITVEAQDKAFETALSFARDYQNKYGLVLPPFLLIKYIVLKGLVHFTSTRVIKISF